MRPQYLCPAWHSFLGFLPISATLVVSSLAAAASSSPPEPYEHDEVRTIVVESASEGPERPTSASSDIEIIPERFAEVPRRKAEDLLTLSPGVILSNVGGEGHPSGILLRGFDAGEGENLELSVEDVPINEVGNPDAHGFADTGFIIPELITSLRFTQGTFDPEQGDFSIAGSAGYSLGLKERGVLLRGEYGRFNAWRSLALFGPRGHETGTFLGIDGQGSAGFGSHRASISGRLMGGYAHTFRRHTHLRMFFAAHHSRFEQAGMIREDDYKAQQLPCGESRFSQFYCTHDENQGGDVSRYIAAARVFREEGHFRSWQSIFVSGRLLEIRENFTGYTTDLDNPEGPRGDGLRLGSRAITLGGRGGLGLRLFWKRSLQTFDVGYQLRYDTGTVAVNRLRSDQGQSYATVLDHTIRVLNPAIYVRGIFAPIHWFELHGGARMDLWVQQVQRRESQYTGGTTEISQQAVALQPRFSAHFIPLEGLRLIAAYGMGSRSGDPNGIARGALDVARTHASEAGVQLQRDDIRGWASLDARLLGFYTHVSKDLAFDEDLGRNVPEGASNHYGALSSLRLGIANWLDLQGSLTWVDAHFEPDNAGPFAWNLGQRVAGVPRIAVRADSVLLHDFNLGGEHFSWNLALGLTHVGKRPLDEGNMGTRYTKLDLGANIRWRGIEMGVDAQNVLNNRYHEVEKYYASNFDASSTDISPALHFAAGAPFSIMGAVTFHFRPH